MLCPKYIRETEGGWTFFAWPIRGWNALDISLRNKKYVFAFKRSLHTKHLRDQKTDERLEIF